MQPNTQPQCGICVIPSTKVISHVVHMFVATCVLSATFLSRFMTTPGSQCVYGFDPYYCSDACSDGSACRPPAARRLSTWAL